MTVEIKSPSAGLITKIHAQPGDNLGVGKPLFDVDADAPKPAGTETPQADKPKPTESKPQ